MIYVTLCGMGNWNTQRQRGNPTVMVIQHLGEKSIQTNRDTSDVLRHIIKKRLGETSPKYRVRDPSHIGNFWKKIGKFLRTTDSE